MASVRTRSRACLVELFSRTTFTFESLWAGRRKIHHAFIDLDRRAVMKSTPDPAAR